MYYNEETILFLDGSFQKANQTFTDLYGQTLHYGYGAFEGIRAYQTQNGVKIFKAKEHYERLKRSCELVNIPFHYTVDEMIAISYELLSRNGFTDAYLRPLVFCDPNMSLSAPNQVHFAIATWEWGAYLGEKHLNVMLSSFCRPHPRSAKIEAKVCGHYVNSILATTEAKKQGYDEGILLDCEGFLAEAAGSNLFFEKEGKMYTPECGHILLGITRATVIELCQELAIPLHEGKFLPEDLAQADAAFLCGTAAEIIAIESFNGKKFHKEWKSSLGFDLQKAYKNLVLEKSAHFLML